MQTYLNLLTDVLDNGSEKTDRTGVGTLSVFGRQVRFNLNHAFPLLTTKKLHWHSIVHELIWFLRGDTHLSYLHDNNVRIWDEWADDSGNLGPIYGKQWRSWPSHDGKSIDQLQLIIEQIRHTPDSRRHIVSSWNVSDLEKMRLAPCHALFQFYVVNGQLSCQLYQRSADIFLGVPFNIASYALLTHIIARMTNLAVGEFIHTFGDLHLYNNHIEQAKEQLLRVPKSLPTLKINENDPITDIANISMDNIILEGYEPYPSIKAPIAV